MHALAFRRRRKKKRKKEKVTLTFSLAFVNKIWTLGVDCSN